ncbi:6-phosphofructokinase [Aromatoleum petrolei]|uniref:Pyrophosphate--fructose 6-phosphate 1-phosphotransferase n=1 Tax=Aromatoleum petrolei TaxID=76116 RepID=A0ABX1MMB6_9RHOO|nr:6-phosphofructokinase [Aromatoleum petrolei]NMF88908.1 diphosphate--fructose-6-phosphate 1-phosphotransferase [Aromatoleum petrolei]QTQ37769.1 Pyrophosphate-fructose 6-phosphate 1-phosphotransferase [Aromatoleum petrolei]
MARTNLLYAQSGGVTAVINATAAAVIAAARERGDAIGTVLAARHGILGALGEDLIDTTTLGAGDLDALSHMPGGAFGSCRFDLDPPDRNPAQYDRLFAVFAAHGIGYFLYNGGNGSMDTVAKISAAARVRGYPLVCVGVPKTVDNDLEGTDCSPGFGSAAKYAAVAMLEAGLDIASMASSAGRVFVLEVMGRNAGWIAAASALAARTEDDPPHIILMPEVPFDEDAFLAAVDATVKRLGYCAVTVSEGIRRADGTLVMEQDHDRKGHVQLGGAGQCLARLIHARLGYKHHWAIPDYLQRAAGHLVSAVDHAQSSAVGRAAVEAAIAGRDCAMPAIRRLSDTPYQWDIAFQDVAAVANLERRVPARFIRGDGLHVTDAARCYLRPLIEGEVYPAYVAGVPDYRRPRFAPVARRLAVYVP